MKADFRRVFKFTSLKNKYVRIATALVSLVACVWLFKKAYAGQDLEQVWEQAKKVNLMWVSIIAIASILCHSVRTLRWQMLLKAVGKDVGFLKLFAALMSAYFVNQAIPRVGELLRPYLLYRSDKISYGTSLGTVVAERIIDTVCLVILLLSCFVFIGDITGDFFHTHISGPLKGYFGVMPYWKMGAIFLAITMVLYLVVEHFQKKEQAKVSEDKPVNKVDEFADDSMKGIGGVLKVENKVLFGLYTLIIWVLYFFMTYLWFFSMDETVNLGVREAVFIWAIGNIGRMVPVQGGGAGAYHYLVIQAFLLFGISAGVAGAMALLIHGLQTVIYVVLGSVSLVGYMLLTGKEDDNVI
ncbi:MAG: flippase-like domain-containing protein [Opitutaceae bacterium]|nr:flippase-like domain-containing protein [Cytophagales bacterium]